MIFNCNNLFVRKVNSFGRDKEHGLLIRNISETVIRIRVSDNGIHYSERLKRFEEGVLWKFDVFRGNEYENIIGRTKLIF